jgi:hypothetical protein
MHTRTSSVAPARAAATAKFAGGLVWRVYCRLKRNKTADVASPLDRKAGYAHTAGSGSCWLRASSQASWLRGVQQVRKRVTAAAAIPAGAYATARGAPLVLHKHLARRSPRANRKSIYGGKRNYAHTQSVIYVIHQIYRDSDIAGRILLEKMGCRKIPRILVNRPAAVGGLTCVYTRVLNLVQLCYLLVL